MRKALHSVLSVCLFLLSVSAWAQSSNPCDLTGDGKVDAADVTAAINMSLGLPGSSCTANIYGTNVCNVVMVQRVINASLGGACVTGTGAVAHSVSLNWTVSSSSGVTGYKVYRGTASGGPYSLVTTVGTTPSATDSSVTSGQTYYYVLTTLAGGVESSYSQQAQAVIPTP